MIPLQITKVLKMSNQMNPFAHVYYKKFREYVSGRGGRLFGGFVEADGTVWTHGDKKYFGDYLSESNMQDEKDALSWVPPGPLPSIPRPLHDMQNYLHFAEIKRTATTFINHFKKPNQKLGEVIFF